MVKKYYQNIKKKESKMKNIYRDHNCGELNIKKCWSKCQTCRLGSKNKKSRSNEIYRFKR